VYLHEQNQKELLATIVCLVIIKGIKACGSEEDSLISLFPVSPSGGKPGREGSPHAGEHVARQQKALALAVRPAPPARGAQPPLRIPPCPSPKAHLGLHYLGASEEMKKELDYRSAFRHGSHQARAGRTMLSRNIGA
jgi:hypothetical protein